MSDDRTEQEITKAIALARVVVKPALAALRTLPGGNAVIAKTLAKVAARSRRGLLARDACGDRGVGDVMIDKRRTG